MSDLISRQDAILALLEKGQRSRRYKLGEIWELNFDEIREVLATVPSAEPVRHGKWIDETFKPWGLVHHPFKCNLCGEHAEFASPYCPNCGADMRGKKNERNKDKDFR